MKYFGTDGIRRIYGKELEDILYRLGYVLASRGKNIVICRDTRASGLALAEKFASGVFDGGGNIVNMGIAPTPAAAYSVREGFDFAASITASHNPSEYNGIKIFDASGAKLDALTMEEIEKAMDEVESGGERALPREEDALFEKYIKGFVSKKLPLKIAVDAANGAGRRSAEKVLPKFFEKVVFVDDGREINSCGATRPERLRNAMQEDFDVGIAFDGDADRLFLIDKKKREYGGNELLYVLALHMKSEKTLKGKVVCSEVNEGLISSLKKKGVDSVRCKVGDSNVYKKEKSTGSNLGGEPSGHVLIDGEQADALKTAIKICEILYLNEDALDGLLLYPEKRFSYPYSEKNLKALEETAEMWRAYLGKEGTVSVRVSGTEPIIRTRVECRSESLFKEIVKDFEKKTIKST